MLHFQLHSTRTSSLCVIPSTWGQEEIFLLYLYCCIEIHLKISITMLVSQSRIFNFFSSKYSIFFMGPSVHFPKSFMHCCFIYHYKERCFPGEAELNREAQNDKSLFGFHLSLTQVSGPMGRLATNGRPIRGRYRRGGVAQISSGPIHNFHCSRLGHLGFPLLHFLAGLDLNTSSTLDFSSAGSTIKWRRRSSINPMKRPLKNLYKEMTLE